MMDRATAKRLIDASIPSVALAFNGADAETHDWSRGKKDTLEEALAGASSCKTESLPFQFNMAVRKQTLSQVPGMLRLAAESEAEAA